MQNKFTSLAIILLSVALAPLSATAQTETAQEKPAVVTPTAAQPIKVAEPVVAGETNITSPRTGSTATPLPPARKTTQNGPSTRPAPSTRGPASARPSTQANRGTAPNKPAARTNPANRGNLPNRPAARTNPTNKDAALDRVAAIPTPTEDIKPSTESVALSQAEASEKIETAFNPALPTPTTPAVKPVTMATEDAIQAENRRRLEEELKNTTISGKSIVDFPNRASLGNLELAPLPGINDSAIRGPLPMAASVSGKDLPSEQLLGRITPEVFQEMADLERGNTFLKLQLEKEKLKNDLEKLKATYRQQRLDEIAKREDVVRSRIQWWQEQEKLRLAIAKKQAEEEALERKIAEESATRDKVRAEAMKRLAASEEAAKKEEGKKDEPIAVSVEPMEELYTLDSIRGIGKDLTARIRSKQDGSVITVKQDDILPSGYVVKEIKKDSLTVAFGNKIDKLIFRPAAQ